MSRLILFGLISIFFSVPVYAQLSPQQELDSIRNLNYERQQSIFPFFKNISSQLDTTKSAARKKDLQDKYDSLQKFWDRLWDDRLQSEFAFVQRHYDSPLSLEVLGFDLIRPEAEKYYSTMQVLYKQISKNLQNTPQGKKLLENIINCENSQVGKKAPAFMVKDLNGKPISLNQFYEKKYVLIDFWASWCVPCRQEFPGLKQVYAMYQPKGLEIISISIDDDTVKWKNAIYKDSIDTWRHLADKENRPSLGSLYFVIAVPIKILIDKQGQIIGRWVGSSKENTEALESKLQSILK